MKARSALWPSTATVTTWSPSAWAFCDGRDDGLRPRRAARPCRTGGARPARPWGRRARSRGWSLRPPRPSSRRGHDLRLSSSNDLLPRVRPWRRLDRSLPAGMRIRPNATCTAGGAVRNGPTASATGRERVPRPVRPRAPPDARHHDACLVRARARVVGADTGTGAAWGSRRGWLIGGLVAGEVVLLALIVVAAIVVGRATTGPLIDEDFSSGPGPVLHRLRQLRRPHGRRRRLPGDPQGRWTPPRRPGASSIPPGLPSPSPPRSAEPTRRRLRRRDQLLLERRDRGYLFAARATASGPW